MPQPITPVETFDAVTAPASSDDLDETEVVNTAQQLADRDETLRGYLRGDRHVHILAGQPVLSGGAEMWAVSTGGLPSWISQANTGEIWIPIIPLVAGKDVVKKVYVIVRPGAARATAGNRMALTLVTRSVDYGTPGAATDTVQVSTVHDDGTATYQKIDLSPGSPLAVTQLLFVRVIAGNTGAASPDQIVGVTYQLDLTQVIT